MTSATRRPSFKRLLGLGGILFWMAVFLAPALAPGRALLGVDLLYRFPPWQAEVRPDWEAANYLLFDQAAQFYPWRLLTRQLAAAGLPPLWNPYAGTGSPLLANQQSATLAPAELAASGFDPPRAPAVATAIRLTVAGAGMFLLATELGIGTAAALFAAMAFLGSGSIAILLYHPNANVSMWLPLIALLSWRLGRGSAGTLLAAALLALAQGAALLGGHPETALYVGLVSIFFFALGAAGFLSPAGAGAETDHGRTAGGRSRRGAALPFFLAAHLLGAAIAAPAILPFLEYLRDGAVMSNRADTRFWNPPACLVGLLVPEIYGTPERPNTYFGPRNYHAVATQYAGMATFVLALIAIVRALRPGVRFQSQGRRRLIITMGSVLALALLLVYPTPVWRLAQHFPLFRISANVTGLTLAITFLLAILGAIGLEVVLRRDPDPGSIKGGHSEPALKHRIVFMLLALGALIALGAWLFLPLARDSLLAAGARQLEARHAAGDYAKPVGHYVARLPLVFAAIRSALLWSGLLGLGLALLIGPGARLARARTLLAVAFLLHLGIDLAHFGRGYVPAIPLAEVFPANAALTEIAALPGINRVLPTGRALPPNTLTGYGIEDFRLHDAVGSRAHSRFEAAMSSAPFLRRPLATYDPDLLAAGGINVLAIEPDEVVSNQALPGLELLERGPLTIARYGRAWPRAFFCANGQEVADDSVAVAAARAEARAATTGAPGVAAGPALPSMVALTPAATNRAVAAPALWRFVNLLYPRITAPPPAALTREAPIPTAPAAEAGRLVHSPLAVTASLTAPTSGWVVLLDQDYPGWRVAVDGAPAQAARAFGVFRAVAVEAGLHSIAWRYEPASFALGLAIALPALAVVLGSLAIGAAIQLSRRR